MKMMKTLILALALAVPAARAAEPPAPNADAAPPPISDVAPMSDADVVEFSPANPPSDAPFIVPFIAAPEPAPPDTAPPDTAPPDTAPPDTAPPEPAPPAPPVTAGPSGPAVEPPPAAPPAYTNGSSGLRLNFRGVPLEMVLNYLSEAAGFIIVLDAQPRGKVDVFSSQPLNREEAVDLLNTVLSRNGLTSIRRGRTLTIINKDEAKTKAIPVRSGGDPETIPDTDEMVTQILPVRFVEVTQLIKDLQPLVSAQTAMTANESGNAIIITDTQSNIRRLAEVIKAIDSGAEDLTVVRVFHLMHADPQETADLLTSLFPDDSRSSTSQSPFAFGGPGAFGRGGRFAAAAGGSNAQSQRIRKRNRVVAVADPRTQSVIVTASKDLMDQIQDVISELDPNPANQKSVAVFPLQNASPQEAMQVLQDIFQKTGTQNRNNQNRNDALQNRGTQQNQQYNSNNRNNRSGGNRPGGF